MLLSILTAVWWVIIIACFVFAFLGCFINKFPSVLLTLVATLIGQICLDINVGWGIIALVAIIWIASFVINKKVLPPLLAKLHEYSKGATWGTTIGSFLGIIIVLAVGGGSKALLITLLILGFGVLPYLFAFLFEYIKCKEVLPASKGAGSAYLLYVANVFIKLIALYLAIYTIFEG